MTTPVQLFSPELIASREFFSQLRAELVGGARIVSWFGRPANESPREVVMTAVLEVRGALEVLRTQLVSTDGFHSLSRDFPSLAIFERELFEQLGVTPHDHPWLKPIRFSAKPGPGVAAYPFYRVDGKEVHEVAVG